MVVLVSGTSAYTWDHNQVCWYATSSASQPPSTYTEVHFVSWSQVLGWSGLDRGLWGPGELQLAEHGYLVFGGARGRTRGRTPDGRRESRGGRVMTLDASTSP